MYFMINTCVIRAEATYLVSRPKEYERKLANITHWYEVMCERWFNTYLFIDHSRNYKQKVVWLNRSVTTSALIAKGSLQALHTYIHSNKASTHSSFQHSLQVQLVNKICQRFMEIYELRDFSSPLTTTLLKTTTIDYYKAILNFISILFY